MHRLAQATFNDHFEAAITGHQYAEGPGDRALAGYLAAETFQNDVIPVLAEVLSNALGCDISFGSLIRAVNEGSPGNKPNPRFYGPETVVEYHMLLLACLVCMASTHEQLDKLLERCLRASDPVVLSKAPVSGELRHHDLIVSLFEMLLTYTRLFLYLISSFSFKTHVEILNKFLPESLIPTRKEKATYERWAGTQVFCKFKFLVEKEKEKEKEKGSWKWWWQRPKKRESENENENEGRTDFDDGDDEETDVGIVFSPSVDMGLN
jgi:hypothetical protein